MTLYRLLPLALCLFLSAAPASESGGWGSWVFEWVASWFTDPPAPATSPNNPTPAPAVNPRDLALLTAVPASDTMAIRGGWPYVSADVAGDLERRGRLLARTTVVANPGGRLPLTEATAVRVLYAEGRRPDRFIEMARRFVDVQALPYEHRLAPALAAAPSLPTLVVAVDGAPGTVPDPWYRALYSLGDYTLVHFGDDTTVGDLPLEWGMINCPLQSKETEAVVAQAVFGAQELNGRLDDGRGSTLPAVRPGFVEPETEGIDRRQLEKLDQTINRAIRAYATPGAQLAVLKDGAVIYEQAYGTHRYRGSETVRRSDLFDLASVTKAAATTLAVMKLYDAGKISLDGRVDDYLPEYRGKVPGRYRVDQLLTHHTGLQSSLPLYPYLHAPFLSDTASAVCSLPLSGERWLDERVPDHLRQDLAQLDHTRRPVFRYSDVNYVLLQFIVEAVSGQPLDAFVADNFYRPMGLSHLAFRPLERFAPAQLAPTIVDKWIQRGEVQGYVHDEGAALLGGVAGHAGLFGNAGDLGRLFQMLLDGGRYNGKQLLSEATVKTFTARGPYNYRALGFDRLSEHYNTVVRAGASTRTFGHTGFTGTCVWADPDNDLVFVLLTNRTYPNPDNQRLMKYGTRSRMHRDLYAALGTFGNPA